MNTVSNQSTPKKFGNALAHWVIDFKQSGMTVSEVDQQIDVALDLLEPLVNSGDIAIGTSGDEIEIQSGGDKKFSFRIGAKARGSINRSDSAWVQILVLIVLSKKLPVQLVDDDSTIIDKRYLKRNWQKFTADRVRFDAVAQIAGLVPGKAEMLESPELADFF